jgi:uncharacterized delta-60 repeat protein
MKRLTRIFASAVSLALAFILVAANLSNQALAAVGDLDSSFGTNGKVTTQVLADFNSASAVALQADGKILAAGLVSPGPGSEDFGLVRYLGNGSLDMNFGVGGKVTTAFNNSPAYANDIAVQANGYILVAGSLFNPAQGASDFAIVRYTTNGSLDVNFGAGGKVVTDFATNSSDYAYAIALQADGKIVVAGSSAPGAAYLNDLALARYNSNGSLDVNFGVGGKVTTAMLAGGNEVATDLAIQADGKIVVVGQAAHSNTSDVVLARYSSNGNLDPGFGIGGKVVTDFSGTSDLASALVIQGDGRIVVGGSTTGPQDRDFVVARYNSNGTPDGGFGAGGHTISDFNGSADFLGGIAIQANGYIVAAGQALSGSTGNFALARYNTSGGLDAGFGIGGKVTTDFFNHVDAAGDVAVQADGQIIAVGGASATGSGAQADFALARYHGSGPIFENSLQDESSDSQLAFNPTTGEYQFKHCSGNFVLGGQGSITIKGCTVILQHNAADRRVLVKFDTCAKKATASVQIISMARTYTITDQDTTNNQFVCP